MGAHAAPGIERVFNSSYQRLVKSELSGKPLLITVTNHPDKQSLKLELIGAKTQQLFSITQKIRRMFDLNSDPLTIGDTFSRSVWHSKLLEKSPGLRIASSWDPFETAVATILGQFVSSSHAQKLLGQLILETGEELDHDFDVPLCMAFPTAEALSKAKLTTVKTTQQRKEAIRSLAKSVLQKRIDLQPHADLNKLRKDLRQIKGVGPWTVEYVCLRAMGDSNAFPDKDLIISRAIEKYPQILKTDVQPWRSYLALLIWKNISA
jgi:AraC family transcriptional regulator of adaptative response / DNA-3-methyladenine glycosylase II